MELDFKTEVIVEAYASGTCFDVQKVSVEWTAEFVVGESVIKEVIVKVKPREVNLVLEGTDNDDRPIRVPIVLNLDRLPIESDYATHRFPICPNTIDLWIEDGAVDYKKSEIQF